MFFSPETEQPVEPKSLGNINADQLNSSQQIIPVTWFAGQRYIAGQFISPAYNQVNERVQAKTGKDSTSTVGTIYYADFGLLMGMGGRQPADAIFKLIYDANIVWENPAGLWRDTDFYEPISVPDYGTAYLYWGYNDQPIDTHIFTPRGVVPVDPAFDPRDDDTWPRNLAAGVTNPVAGHYDRHGRYPAQILMLFKKWKLGRERTQVGALMAELRRGVPWFDGVEVDRDAMGLNSDARGVNPVGAFYDLLTDKNFGLRRTDAELRLAGFTAALERFKDFRISPIITAQMSAKAAIIKLLEYIDGFPREWLGLIDIGWWEHGPIDLGSVPVLTDDDLDGEPELKPTGFLDSDTSFFISYRDREHHYQAAPQKYDDPNARELVGEERRKIIERDWLTDADLAKRYITEYGTMMTAPKQAGPIPAKREWIDNNFPQDDGPPEGNVFLFNSASKGLSILLRLNELEWPEDRSGRVNLEVENERGYWPALYYPPPDTRLGIFKINPVEIEDARIVLVPPDLKTVAGTLQIAVIAARPSHRIVSFSVWTSQDDATYDRVGLRLEFGVHGKIKAEDYAADTDVVDTTIGFVCDLYGPDLEKIQALSDQQRDDNHLLVWINNEIMSVGNVEALGAGRYRIYPRRSLYGTIQAAHPIDSDVWFIFRDNFSPLSHVNFSIGAVRYFKLQPFNQTQDLDLADVTAIEYTFPALPPELLAPFALKVSRLYRVEVSPGVFEAHVAFTWDWALEQTVDSFDITWRAGGLAGLAGEWDTLNVAAAGVTINDGFGVPYVKRQSIDLVVGASNLNYQIRVRAIDDAIPSAWSDPLSRRTVSSTTAEPSHFKHFTSKTDLEAYDVTGMNVGDAVFVTINGTTQIRQLQAGAPVGATQWNVLNQSTMHWSKTL